eukprot:3155350-Amphidinium_carterae.1
MHATESRLSSIACEHSSNGQLSSTRFVVLRLGLRVFINIREPDVDFMSVQTSNEANMSTTGS